ncbi:DNA-formamidopyrimidine glycosylase [Fictibacillus sp. S7]|uniref:DNA-formamidopyrimidine glycosylase n=1 Tax=Fictibacillus sp. S7 TaxID=2212476 RepID=UPI00101180EC|nr:DNA-formamidopyrimidine glycosylase [Fictibacillus sp. S7]RXY98194.1 DNA-formamidopyrimidine glycosylase [Fictibacillus sp. S7]
MPELPEVENVKNTLNRLVGGKTIKEVSVLWSNIIKHPELDEFKLRLKGQTIQNVERRGKFLKIFLDHDVLVSHLRMEGKYGLNQLEDPSDKHTHVLFSFTDGTQLRYRDVRKFGTMHLYPIGKEEQEQPLSKLGYEPFSAELTPSVMKKMFSKTSRSIKAVLLDQSLITGLGNIYVDEILFASGIHPERKANEVSLPRLQKLHEHMVSILKNSVEKGGSTIRSYTNSEGKTGNFQLELFVYGKKGEPCKTCGSEIDRSVVAGRGTHFCSKCQK